MLKPSYYTEPTEVDQLVFEKLVPVDHYLRRVKEVIDFERLRELVRDCYSPDMGRTAEDPVRMIKLEFLQYQYNLSDREVLKQVQVNVAYRFFLDLSLDSALPTSGLLSQFRTRLGQERHQALFEDLVAQARAHGLIKDRLRLKDATHIIANLAIPATIRLVAQARQRLLKGAHPFAQGRVAQEEERAAQIRRMTDELDDEERLVQRVAHLRQIVDWADELQASLDEGVFPADPNRQRFAEALALAHRIVEQSEDPDQPDKIRSLTDPDARMGLHGGLYTGYQLDVSLDADSELITAVETPPANQDEAANAEHLIQQEEQAHGNDVLAISMDAIGFRGDVLRTLKDPQGCGLEVYVPPQEWYSYQGPHFTPDDFHLVDNGQTCVCPAEEETRARNRNANDTGWQFVFRRIQCLQCSLLELCMAKMPAANGRKVIKNDYVAEYQAARALAKTERYAQVRQEHPKIERKFAEIVRYHDGRRARYRGRERVLIQYLLTAMVVNVKRMVKLLEPEINHPHNRLRSKPYAI